MLCLPGPPRATGWRNYQTRAFLGYYNVTHRPGKTMSCSLTLLNALSAAVRTYDLLGVQDQMDGFVRLLQRQTGVVNVPEPDRLSRVNHQSYEGADARWRKENLEPAVRETIERHTPCDAFLYGVAKGWFADDARRAGVEAGGAGEGSYDGGGRRALLGATMGGVSSAGGAAAGGAGGRSGRDDANDSWGLVGGAAQAR